MCTVLNEPKRFCHRRRRSMPRLRAAMCALLALCASFAIPQHTQAAEDLVDRAQQRALLPNIGTRGVFDPSITEDPATGRLWMSYSSFDASTHSRWGIGVRLAYSDDGET